MQNNPRSHGLWELTAPPAPQTHVLAGAVDADVVVLGGGYMGLSAALHLAEGGAKVVVLEAVDVGFGGAGRNVGLVNAGLWVMPDTVEEVLGPVFGPRLLEQLSAAPQLVFDIIEKHRIDCELEQSGTLHCAVGRSGLRELEQRAAQWRARGAPVQLLDASQTFLKVGSSAYAGALLDQRAGTIQPLAYSRGLARAAIAAGARIFTGSPAVSAEDHAGRRWLTHTPQGTVSSDWIVVATDAYAVGPWRAVRSEQVHLHYFNFATAPLPAAARAVILPGRQGAWDTQEVLSSFRLDRAGRLVFGSVGALRGAGASIHRAWAKRTVGRLFPQIGQVRFETAWFGQIGMTADNIPRFHRLDRNVVSFSGLNGRGIAPGTTFGRLLAKFVLGALEEGDLPLPPSLPFDPPFRALKEVVYDLGSQLVHLTA